MATTAPASITQGELCGELEKFFLQELRAVEVRAIPNVSVDARLSGGGVCELAQDQNVIGHFVARAAPSDTDPTAGQAGYKREDRFGNGVWVYDLRSDRDNPSNKVRFAVRVKTWNSTLEILDSETRTSNGALNLTDEGKRKAVQFLTVLTTRMAA
ncbi:hypothetical protein [Nocardia neocaledoniensis]|uniref:hypothetical protein n=1 Tax=Nocardia neocaledoniensis TaxID=236511 RepID=UPI0011B79270|nr:hypothetical protein [Nocardia neocaledoniensis]